MIATAFVCVCVCVVKINVVLVHQCSINGDSEQQEPLCLVNTGRRFCIFSVFFSSDGKEILGGANDGCLYIYDRQRHERTHKVCVYAKNVAAVKKPT